MVKGPPQLSISNTTHHLSTPNNSTGSQGGLLFNTHTPQTSLPTDNSRLSSGLPTTRPTPEIKDFHPSLFGLGNAEAHRLNGNLSQRAKRAHQPRTFTAEQVQHINSGRWNPNVTSWESYLARPQQPTPAAQSAAAAAFARNGVPPPPLPSPKNPPPLPTESSASGNPDRPFQPTSVAPIINAGLQNLGRLLGSRAGAAVGGALAGGNQVALLPNRQPVQPYQPPPAVGVGAAAAAGPVIREVVRRIRQPPQQQYGDPNSVLNYPDGRFGAVPPRTPPVTVISDDEPASEPTEAPSVSVVPDQVGESDASPPPSTNPVPSEETEVSDPSLPPSGANGADSTDQPVEANDSDVYDMFEPAPEEPLTADQVDYLRLREDTPPAPVSPSDSPRRRTPTPQPEPVDAEDEEASPNPGDDNDASPSLAAASPAHMINNHVSASAIVASTHRLSKMAVPLLPADYFAALPPTCRQRLPHPQAESVLSAASALTDPSWVRTPLPLEDIEAAEAATRPVVRSGGVTTRQERAYQMRMEQGSAGRAKSQQFAAARQVKTFRRSEPLVLPAGESIRAFFDTRPPTSWRWVVTVAREFPLTTSDFLSLALAYGTFSLEDVRFLRAWISFLLDGGASIYRTIAASQDQAAFELSSIVALMPGQRDADMLIDLWYYQGGYPTSLASIIRSDDPQSAARALKINSLMHALYGNRTEAVFVILSRKTRNKLQHALNGNTSTDDSVPRTEPSGIELNSSASLIPMTELLTFLGDLTAKEKYYDVKPSRFNSPEEVLQHVSLNGGFATTSRAIAGITRVSDPSYSIPFRIYRQDGTPTSFDLATYPTTSMVSPSIFTLSKAPSTTTYLVSSVAGGIGQNFTNVSNHDTYMAASGFERFSLRATAAPTPHGNILFSRVAQLQDAASEFSSLDNTVARSNQGTGLGLSQFTAVVYFAPVTTSWEPLAARMAYFLYRSHFNRLFSAQNQVDLSPLYHSVDNVAAFGTAPAVAQTSSVPGRDGLATMYTPLHPVTGAAPASQDRIHGSLLPDTGAPVGANGLSQASCIAYAVVNDRFDPSYDGAGLVLPHKLVSKMGSTVGQASIALFVAIMTDNYWDSSTYTAWQVCSQQRVANTIFAGNYPVNLHFKNVHVEGMENVLLVIPWTSTGPSPINNADAMAHYNLHFGPGFWGDNINAFSNPGLPVSVFQTGAVNGDEFPPPAPAPALTSLGAYLASWATEWTPAVVESVYRTVFELFQGAGASLQSDVTRWYETISVLSTRCSQPLVTIPNNSATPTDFTNYSTQPYLLPPGLVRACTEATSAYFYQDSDYWCVNGHRLRKWDTLEGTQDDLNHNIYALEPEQTMAYNGLMMGLLTPSGQHQAAITFPFHFFSDGKRFARWQYCLGNGVYRAFSSLYHKYRLNYVDWIMIRSSLNFTTRTPADAQNAVNMIYSGDEGISQDAADAYDAYCHLGLLPDPGHSYIFRSSWPLYPQAITSACVIDEYVNFNLASPIWTGGNFVGPTSPLASFLHIHSSAVPYIRNANHFFTTEENSGPHELVLPPFVTAGFRSTLSIATKLSISPYNLTTECDDSSNLFMDTQIPPGAAAGAAPIMDAVVPRWNEDRSSNTYDMFDASDFRRQLRNIYLQHISGFRTTPRTAWTATAISPVEGEARAWNFLSQVGAEDHFKWGTTARITQVYRYPVNFMPVPLWEFRNTFAPAAFTSRALFTSPTMPVWANGWRSPPSASVPSVFAARDPFVPFTLFTSATRNRSPTFLFIQLPSVVADFTTGANIPAHPYTLGISTRFRVLARIDAASSHQNSGLPSLGIRISTAKYISANHAFASEVPAGGAGGVGGLEQ